MYIFGVSGGKTIYGRRCGAITEQLKKHNVPVKRVGRHHFYNIRVYCIEIKIGKCGKWIDDDDIAEALNIPKEWIAFIHINTEHRYKLYFVKEDELNSKYCDDDGELIFKKPFKLTDYPFKQKFETLCPISNRLKEMGIIVDKIDIWDDYLMLKIEYDEDVIHTTIANALDCDVGLVEAVKIHHIYAIKRWDK